VLGRAFSEGDDKPGGPQVALISEALWRRRFGADPAIVGQSAMVNGTGYTVIGIAPAALTTLTNGDVFVPLVIDRRRRCGSIMCCSSSAGSARG